MKKILFLVLALIFMQSAHADFIPQYVNSITHWGIGAVVMDREFSIYEENSENSKLIKKIKWSENAQIICSGDCLNNQLFVTWVPSKSYAIMSALDEIEGWAQVYYDQKTAKLGWVKLSDKTKFFTWAEFMTTYGKKHGYFLFKDIKKEERKLYSQPQEASQIVDSWEIAKYIAPWYIKGNWMMAKVLDFDNAQKTGWLKWRGTDGTLYGFVNFKN